MTLDAAPAPIAVGGRLTAGDGAAVANRGVRFDGRLGATDYSAQARTDANGAYALAVATGRNHVDELVAAGADCALDDLSDIERTVSVICG